MSTLSTTPCLINISPLAKISANMGRRDSSRLEMAQTLRTFTAFSEDLDSAPSTHIRWLIQPFDLCEHLYVHSVHKTHSGTHIYILKINLKISVTKQQNSPNYLVN